MSIGPPRPSYSKGNMAKSCGSWRHKSFKRRAEVKPTSSPPARPLCTPVLWSSRACWWIPTMFYWGRHLNLTHLPYHKGPLQWSNSLPQLLLPHQCPSSLLSPKDVTLPQILWTAFLWKEPHQRWLQKGPPSPSSKRSYLWTKCSSQAMWRIWPGLWLGKGGQEGILFETFL